MRDFLIYTNEYFLDKDGRRHSSPMSVRDLASLSVLRSGSDLRGRAASFYYFTGVSYKIPVILCDNADRAWFCTRSLLSSDCVLINEERLLLTREKTKGPSWSSWAASAAGYRSTSASWTDRERYWKIIAGSSGKAL